MATDLRFILRDPSLTAAEQEQCYEYFRRWRRLLSAAESGALSAAALGWGNAAARLVFVINRPLSKAELQLLYRMAAATRVPVYFTYAHPDLAAELDQLPAGACVVRIGTDIPDLAELTDDSPAAAEKKRSVWQYLKQKLKPMGVF